MSQAVTHSPAAWAGRDLTARQATTAACLGMTVVTLIDRADGQLGFLFSLGFVLICVTAALSVDLESLFPTGVLPPALLIGALVVVAMWWPDAIQVDGLAANAGFVTRLIAGVIDHGATLIIGHGLALGVIALRILTAPDR